MQYTSEAIDIPKRNDNIGTGAQLLCTVIAAITQIVLLIATNKFFIFKSLTPGLMTELPTRVSLIDRVP